MLWAGRYISQRVGTEGMISASSLDLLVHHGRLRVTDQRNGHSEIGKRLQRINTVELMTARRRIER